MGGQSGIGEIRIKVTSLPRMLDEIITVYTLQPAACPAIALQKITAGNSFQSCLWLKTKPESSCLFILLVDRTQLGVHITLLYNNSRKRQLWILYIMITRTFDISFTGFFSAINPGYSVFPGKNCWGLWQHVFYRSNAIPDAEPTAPKYWKKMPL